MENNTNIKKTSKSIKSLTKGVIISYIITAITFVVYGILLTYTDITEENIQMVVMITTVVSVLIGGFITSRGVSGKGLIYGTLVGIVYALIMIMVGLTVIPDIKMTTKMIMIIILSVSAGGIGGIIGINTKKV